MTRPVGFSRDGGRGLLRFVFPGFLLRWLLRSPRDTAALLAAAVAFGAIIVNGLFLQSGPHPAPMFPVRPSAVVADGPTGTLAAALPRPRPADVASTEAQITRPRGDLIADVQRELARRGYYDGAVDGAYGAKTDAAIRDFEQSNGLKSTGEASDLLLQAILRSAAKTPSAAPRQPARKDPIADLLSPSRPLAAIQRALTDFGYGQITPNGQYGPETRAAIERFERERKMPITGQVSDRLARELTAMTGRPL
jgi:peptidoglycan hydrolase-like protein with peptidoglycan-binding domain